MALNRNCRKRPQIKLVSLCTTTPASSTTAMSTRNHLTNAVLLLLSLISISGVASFRSTTIIRTSSPVSRQMTVPTGPLFMASENERGKSIGKAKGRKTTKSPKKHATDTSLLLQELDQKIDAYEGRLPSKNDLDNLQQHRCGFVGIVGAPNMGKSTLLNALLKEDLCIATRRPQTTRHAILGVMSSATRQCCLLDTPGVLQGEGAYKLQANMMEAVKGALKDSDVLLVVTDMFSTPIPDDEIFRRLAVTHKPVLVVVNKIDLEGRAQRPVEVPYDEKKKEMDQEEEEEFEKTYTVAEAVAKWRALLPNALAIIPLAASGDSSSEDSSESSFTDEHPGITLLRQILVGSGNDKEDDIPASIRALGRPVPGMFRTGVRTLTNDDARTLLPEGPPLYDDDFLSDRSVRFFCSELVRESLLESQYLKKELPYCCEVQITEFREPRKENEITRIEATIFVERDGQKAIVVGKNGSVIKQVGIVAREKIEKFLDGEKIFLQLRVKVDKDWRKKDDALTKYGYSN